MVTIHPDLFAAVDGTGRLDLWNLDNDTEVKTFLIFCLIASYRYAYYLPTSPLFMSFVGANSEQKFRINDVT